MSWGRDFDNYAIAPAMAPVLPSLSLAAPALIATARGALWRAVDGTIERLKPAEHRPEPRKLLQIWVEFARAGPLPQSAPGEYL